MPPWLRTSALCLLLLPSCARIPGLDVGSKPKADTKEEALARKEAMQAAMASARGSSTPVKPGSNVTVPDAMITAPEDIVWSDADHPENGIKELSALMAAPKKGPWEENEGVARQRSMREGKPLLIWFTDSQYSPNSRMLADQLFSKKDFEQWAKEKFVRLRVDSFTKVSDPKLSMDETQEKEIENKHMVEDMTKRYKILGSPVLIVLTPGGDVIGRYKGYRSGDADYTWGLLRQGESIAARSAKEWRSGLEKNGYREWQDRNGNKAFAKLMSYSAGTLYLVGPDGTRSRTNENRLSDPDRDWIKQQKAQRGIQ